MVSHSRFRPTPTILVLCLNVIMDQSKQPYPQSDTPTNLRPDLSIYGIEQLDLGICVDSSHNRRILRENKLSWSAMFDEEGHPLEAIEVRSMYMTAALADQSVAHRTNIMRDPRNVNSDYKTGTELLLAWDADTILPPWVLGATRFWESLVEDRAESGKNLLPHIVGPPMRCSVIKSDGVRCLYWTSGRVAGNDMCRVHLSSLQNNATGMLDRSRIRVKQNSLAAVDTLEDLMMTATSEPVRLQAARDILDRAGVRAGFEIDVAIADQRPAGDILRDKMLELRKNLTATSTPEEETDDTIVAEVIEDE